MSKDGAPPAVGMRDASGSERPRPPAGMNGLSIVHIPRKGEPKPDAVAGPRVYRLDGARRVCGEVAAARAFLPAFERSSVVSVGKTPDAALPVARVWDGASRAEFPAIRCKDPNEGVIGDRNETKRGLIKGLSDSARRRLHRTLATVRADVRCATMALTLPADFMTGEECRAAFATLSKRFVEAFPSVGFAWKRELQKRGAVHYHLLLWGVEDGETPSNDVHQWLASHWHRLVGRNDPKHLAWHLHGNNWQVIKDDMKGYFAKYIGKDLEAEGALFLGRWWGFVNRKAVPFVAVAETSVSARAAVYAHRVARKHRQKRADQGKLSALVRKVLPGSVTLPGWASLWGVQQLRQGYLDGVHDPVRAGLLLHILKKFGKANGCKPGRVQFDKYCRYGAITILGTSAPDIWHRIMSHAKSRAQESEKA